MMILITIINNNNKNGGYQMVEKLHYKEIKAPNHLKNLYQFYTRIVTKRFIIILIDNINKI